jgi:hypothetical protein
MARQAIPTNLAFSRNSADIAIATATRPGLLAKHGFCWQNMRGREPNSGRHDKRYSISLACCLPSGELRIGTNDNLVVLDREWIAIPFAEQASFRDLAVHAAPQVGQLYFAPFVAFVLFFQGIAPLLS